MKLETRCTLALAALAALLVTGAAVAQEVPERSPAVAAKVFRHADLTIPALHQEVGQLPAAAAEQARQRLARLGVDEASARVDQRSGRFVTLLPTTHLLQGGGHPAARAWTAFVDYLDAHRDDLRVDLGELSSSYGVTSHGDGALYQITAPRDLDGIPVRGSYISAVIGQGNLTLMGLHLWGDATPAPNRPRISSDEALFAAEGFLSPLKVTREWGKAHLVYVPMARGRAPEEVAFGQGYSYRLAWSIKVVVDGDGGRWEVLADAHTGEVLANEDQNHYAEVRGGVYPVTNDGIVPDGVEQPGWPMPYLDVATSSGTQTTDTGGNVAASGSLAAALEGTYIRINDNCGAISLTQSDGLDFGTSGGTDCTTPGFGGAGNTHASRTGYYELNKIIEMGRGQLPSNAWLQQQLTSNMNINLTCNAYWGGGSVNFYRSGGGCANTGEIAGVFDHEWGHGLDDNDAVPTISGPSGEGIADIYAALRLNDSCIGRNFRTTVCSGFGDPCLTCTGVRDIDYLKRQSGQPHDYSWSNANCSGSVHCVGGVYSEAVWSLWKRGLTAAPYGMDNNTAGEVVTRLTYLGAGNTGTWFSGGPPWGGCGSSSGYMNYLAADDDNGNLNDGTPHMTAIYNAFNDQEIACDTPAVQDSGCAGTPSIAPTVSASAGNKTVSLSWGAVADATRYQVFRTEGVFGCDFGKVKLGETTGTSWNDSGLQNGRDYSYIVIPIGAADSCLGPASSCTAGQPVGQPDFTVACSPASHTLQQGTTATSTCTVSTELGYSGSVGLSCSGNPAGIGCSFAPSSVSPPIDGSADSTLTLAVDLAQATGSYSFDVVADDGTLTRTSAIGVLVISQGSQGPQDASYDAGLGTPACLIPGSECDSLALLDGRAGLGPEPNQPNTLDSCTDGTSGTYHVDESNDGIVVRTLDGSDFVEGATVEVEATVWGWSTGSSDTLDLYYAADANTPSWTHIASIVPPGGGAQVVTAQYTLPQGGLQAVRANFRYLGSESSCSGGSYDDADDLVFAVNTGSSGCTIDADCDDGLYCNGAETCGAGSCQAGTAPTCDDGVGCTVDSCNEGTDSCDFNTSDALCDNGLFCDGAETCDAVLGCQAGTAVSCDDGVGCTIDACDEGTDSCDHPPDDAVCDNGVFCDGAETCDAVNDCQAGGLPCSGLFCDEGLDICYECNVDADCDDGLFCNGIETCSGGGCSAGTAPCAGACDEVGDTCISCASKGDSCTVDSDCCSGKCRGKTGSLSCK